METKLTIKLPDTLHRRAKAAAALRGDTLSEILRSALEEYIAETVEEADDIREVLEIEARLASGEEKLHSHEEVWAEIEALEAAGELPG